MCSPEALCVRQQIFRSSFFLATEQIPIFQEAFFQILSNGKAISRKAFPFEQIFQEYLSIFLLIKPVIVSDEISLLQTYAYLIELDLPEIRYKSHSLTAYKGLRSQLRASEKLERDFPVLNNDSHISFMDVFSIFIFYYSNIKIFSSFTDKQYSQTSYSLNFTPRCPQKKLFPEPKALENVSKLRWMRRFTCSRHNIYFTKFEIHFTQLGMCFTHFRMHFTQLKMHFTQPWRGCKMVSNFEFWSLK